MGNLSFLSPEFLFLLPDCSVQPGDNEVYCSVQEKVENLLVDIEKSFWKNLVIRTRVKRQVEGYGSGRV